MPERVLIAQGREAEVFLQPDGTVLKLMRDPAWVDRVEHEAAALRAVASAGHGIAVHGIVTVDGRPGLVTDRVPGDDLLKQMGRNPFKLDGVAAAMARAHAEMHEVVAPASLPDLKDELRARIERAEPLPDELRAGALEVLAELPAGDRLCHGDLHPGNMMGSLREPVVIDWGDASRGDPLGDVVRTALLLRVGQPPPGAPMFIRVLAPIGRGFMSTRYVAHYRKLRPFDAAAFAPWRLVRAAARLAEHIPAENPALLRIVRRDLAAYNR
jgi:aminoglycoside phosphotransferase (APT) family kinase protein